MIAIKNKLYPTGGGRMDTSRGRVLFLTMGEKKWVRVRLRSVWRSIPDRNTDLTNLKFYYVIGRGRVYGQIQFLGYQAYKSGGYRDRN
jgi:hypothetical protein